MASMSLVHASVALPSLKVRASKQCPPSTRYELLSHCAPCCKIARPGISSLSERVAVRGEARRGRKGVVVCAVGDVSAEGNNFLIAGAVAIALIGTALPFVFSRKDTCPVCDGAGFVRGGQGTGGALKANAARKDQSQIVCKNCNGLGKIGQIDKA